MRALARALLVFVTLWPCVTLWLQARFDVDPWKLMSFGMYAAPSRRPSDVELVLSVERDGAWVQVPEPVGEGTAFRKWRRTLGRLASHEALGRVLLTQTAAKQARIEVRELRLDRETGRVTWRSEAVLYPP
ncbi:MAG: hypothetical protein JNK82_27895 [Myxococcaceae bacterium]|nr:hypothetical protein [Myxococcaceae bacterium]